MTELCLQAVEVVGGRPSTSNDQKVSATVKVLVRDKNDESPTFNKHAYDITIDEELARGRSLPDLDMIVKDNDLVSRLGELFFNLLVYCILKMSCTYVLRVSRIIPGNYVMTNYKVTVYGYHYNRTDCDVE